MRAWIWKGRWRGRQSIDSKMANLFIIIVSLLSGIVHNVKFHTTKG